MATTTFKVSDRIHFECYYYNRRDGFGHRARLFVDGKQVDQGSAHYYNRTWERFEYQSVMKHLVRETPELTPDEKELVNTYLDNYKGDSGFSAVGLVAMMGDIFCDNKKDANDWKKRMLKAGMGEGLSFPDDWDSLSEEEKEKRLNKVIEVSRGKEG